MRLKRTFAQILPALLLAALMAATVRAAPIPWTTPSGSTPDFDYSGGQSDNGLFGDPVINGSQFLFFPHNFIATSSNGVAVTTSDRLEFTIVMHANKKVNGISVSELGDYSILGTGTVSAAGELLLTNLNSPFNT